MVTATSLHYIRLFYLVYFAAMGLVLPFFPVYLQQTGLGAGMIGVMTGLLAAARVIAPPWLGHILDHRHAGAVRLVLISSALLAALFASMLGAFEHVLLLALVTLLFGIFWAILLPLTDGLSVSVSEAALADYGRLRVWGSVGFVIASLAGGAWLMGDSLHETFPAILVILMLVTAFAATGFPTLHAPVAESTGMGRPRFSVQFRLLLAIAFIMQASHGAYYGFFSLYLSDAGYAGGEIGAYWVIGVLAEIVMMWLWGRRVQQVAPAWVFAVCMLLAAMRWLGIGLTTNGWILVVLQLLHAASFAAFHVAAIAWVRRLAPVSRHSAAQGLFSAAGFGLGSTVGMMMCGWIVEVYGFSAAFLCCSAIAVVGVPLSLLLPRRMVRG
ncbi:MFS transporter [Mariprofundus erugo]|uniref:MFS transporter n=1 Tax=Mariprofundus erugo TaxID=2528639 RepID=A0A5R9GS58_9PROT|nr:MFS transporter [Mariprofundus erugo]TLS68720.1 MFS transporter [Mariprofundus erugo]